MAGFFTWLSNSPTATTSLIVAFGIVISTTTLMYLVAFYQGRAISFWPPKIGAKPEQARNSISLQSKRIEKLKFEEFPREWRAQVWKSDQCWHVEDIAIYCTYNLKPTELIQGMRALPS